MTETKYLTKEKLKQVSGGAEAPDGRKQKYNKGDIVEYFNSHISKKSYKSFRLGK